VDWCGGTVCRCPGAYWCAVAHPALNSNMSIVTELITIVMTQVHLLERYVIDGMQGVGRKLCEIK
jgi:hypothetical protein